MLPGFLVVEELRCAAVALRRRIELRRPQSRLYMTGERGPGGQQRKNGYSVVN